MTRVLRQDQGGEASCAYGPVLQLVAKGVHELKAQQHILRRVSFLVLVQFASAAGGFITQLKIANTLGRDLFGQVAFGVLLGMYGQTVIRFGLDRTLVRDLVHFPDRAAHLVQASLLLRYVVAAPVVLCLITWKLASHSLGISWGVVLIAVAGAVLSLDLQPLYDAWHKMQRHASYFLLQRGLYLVSAWAVIWACPQSCVVTGLGVALLISTLLYLFLQHRWAMQRLGTEKRSVGDVTRDAIALARRNWLVVLASLAALVTVKLNETMLQRHVGFAELGGYAAAWQILLIGNIFLDQVSRVGRPATALHVRAGSGRGERLRFLVKYTAGMCITVLPLVVVMLCFPGFFFRLLFNPEYAPAAKVVPILGGYLLVLGVGNVAAQYVLSAKLERGYFNATMLGAIVSTCSCAVLVPRFGTSGAAWALLVSHGTSIILYVVIVAIDLGYKEKAAPKAGVIAVLCR